MTTAWAIRVAAVVNLLAVGLGAFGAHGLAGLLEKNDRVETWETAVLYHLAHGVALLILGMAPPKDFKRGPWFLLLAGIVIFSGTLYALALTNLRWLGAITPLGGVSFLAGWLWLACAPGTNDRREVGQSS